MNYIPLVVFAIGELVGGFIILKALRDFYYKDLKSIYRQLKEEDR